MLSDKIHLEKIRILLLKLLHFQNCLRASNLDAIVERRKHTSNAISRRINVRVEVGRNSINAVLNLEAIESPEHERLRRRSYSS